MLLTTDYTDTLQIELVKAHLLIDHDLDDVILQHYIVASLETIESEADAQFFVREWANEAHELIPFLDGTIRLSLPVDADKVLIDDGLLQVQLNNTQWYFCSDGIIIDLSQFDFTQTLVSVTAETGQSDVVNKVNQLRLLIIGEWYNSRENAVIGSISQEIPTGLKFMIQKLREVAL